MGRLRSLKIDTKATRDFVKCYEELFSSDLRQHV